MTEPKKTYICGVCRQVKEGSPMGGFNTIHGEVVTCSSKCWVDGMTTGQPVSANAMHAAAHQSSKPS